MSRSSLCDYIDAYLVFKGTITIKNTTAGNDVNKHVIFKKCAPFTSCIMRTNNTQTDDAQYTDVVMSIYSLKKCSDNYSKTSGILWQYCRDELAVNDDGQLLILLELILLLTRFLLNKKQQNNNVTKHVQINVPLKYLQKLTKYLRLTLVFIRNSVQPEKINC